MHYSEGGAAPPGAGPGGPFEELLLTSTTNELCLNCHDGSNPDAPDVENASGYEPAAGRFAAGGMIVEENRHSLGSSASPPGFTGGDWSGILTCTSCHEPHENDLYRNLVTRPGGGDEVRVTAMSGPVYDGVSAVQEIETSRASVRYAIGNIRYRRSVGGGGVSGLSRWCGGCHGEFYGAGGTPNMGGHPGGDQSPGREWLRHPVRDVTISEAYANGHLRSDDWFQEPASRVPVVSPTVVPGTPTDSDNETFCGTCHAAHGTANPDALIHDQSGTPAFGDGGRMTETCTQCHFGSTFPDSPHGDAESGVERIVTDPPTTGECSQCHYQHASVDGDPTGGPFPEMLFTGNTAGLCADPGGCHQDTPFGYPAGENDRMPEGSAHPGYFEYNSGGVKIPGVNNRKRWPGMTAWEDQRTFGAGRYYSPHRNDPDMPLRDPEGNGLCANCHDPHGTDSPFDMLTGTYLEVGGSQELGPPQNYELCFGCHGPDGPVGMSEESRRIADFYDSRINDDRRAGHQIRMKRDIALSWPSHIERGDKLPCSDCHNPHGSIGNDGVQSNGFLLSDERPGWSGLTDTRGDPEQARRFCFGCHIPSDGVPGSRTVGGIVMNTIPNEGPFHREAGTTSCYDCHGRDYSTSTGFNVHHLSEGEDHAIRPGRDVEAW
jgi:hypothetical protein